MYLSDLWFPPDLCPGVGLLDHMLILFLVFQRKLHTVLPMVVPICIPTNCVGGFPFLRNLSTFIVCRFFDGGHSEQYEVIPHCSFDLHFSNN